MYPLLGQGGTGIMFREVTKLRVLLFAFLSVSLILSACAGRSYHATPLDALTEFPGYLINPD